MSFDQSDLDIYRLQNLAAARRRRNLILAGVVLLPVVYWGLGFVTVPDYLEHANFEKIEVSAGSSPLEFTFKAKRELGETCRGTVTRMPFSISHKSTCERFVDVNGKPMDDPRKR